jgi:DnaJ-class molecular chaperone
MSCDAMALERSQGKKTAILAVGLEVRVAEDAVEVVGMEMMMMMCAGCGGNDEDECRNCGGAESHRVPASLSTVVAMVVSLIPS